MRTVRPFRSGTQSAAWCLSLLLTGIAGTSVTAAEPPQVFVRQATEMIEFLERLRDTSSEEELSQALSDIVSGPSYTAMFAHYNRSWRPDHLPKADFESMVLGLRGDFESPTNDRAAQMLPRWTGALTRLDGLVADVRELERLVDEGLVENAIAEASRWLPPTELGISVDEVHFYLDGGSFPWANEGAVGVDVLQLPRSGDGSIDLAALEPLLAHEFHHLGLAAAWAESDREPLAENHRLALRFLRFLVGEGSAMKLVNNAPGGRVPAIASRSADELDESMREDWRVYRLEEPELFAEAARVLGDLLAGRMSEGDLNESMRTYWLPGPPRALGRNYYLGAELIGSVYHAHGREAVFRLIVRPECLLAEYNRAAERLAELEDAPRFPSTLADGLCRLTADTAYLRPNAYNTPS